jgi:MFS superfamily sulfate permease-like transporter
VIFWGVLQGIVLAIILAVVLFFRRSWSPHGVVLGEVAHLPGWHSTRDFPMALERPDVVVFRWEAPLFFANCGQFRDAVRRLVRTREPDWIMLQCEAITDIDVTAGEMLRDLDLELNADGIHLAFVEMRTRLQELVLRYGLFETLDRDHFYPSMRVALEVVDSDEPDAADR